MHTRTSRQTHCGSVSTPCRILRETNRLLKEGDYLKGDPGKQTTATEKRGKSASKKNNFFRCRVRYQANTRACAGTYTPPPTPRRVSFNLFCTSTPTDSPQTLHCGEVPEGCAEISGDATVRKTRGRLVKLLFNFFFLFLTSVSITRSRCAKLLINLDTLQTEVSE